MTEHKQSENYCECCILAAQQRPVAGARCKIIDNCKSCQHSAGRQSCMLANRAFEGRELPPTPPDWCPLPLYAAPQQPVQQEPVAWMYEWNGRTHITTADQRPIEHAHPHFNKSKPLYTAPNPARQPLTDEQIIDLGPGQPDAVWSYEDQLYFARAIEAAAANQPPRQPLTEEQIKAAVRHLYGSDAVAAMAVTGDIETARAIEKAHGITGGQP